MVKLGHFEVSLLIDGKPVREYVDEEVKFDSLVYEIYIDGYRKLGQHLPRNKHRAPGSTIEVVDSCNRHTKDGRRAMMFRFGKISLRETTEDDDIETLKEQHKDVGSIHFKVWRTNAGHDEISRSPAKNPNNQSNKNPIAHKVFTESARTVLTDGLKSLLVNPRTPSPTPLEDRPVEELTLNERALLIERMRADMEASKKKIKVERRERNLAILQSFKRSQSDADSDEEVQAIAARPAKRRAPDANTELVELSD